LLFLARKGKITVILQKDKDRRMKKRVMDFCRQNGLLRRGDRVVLGLSGGADSVFLFLVLAAMKEEWELELIPVHVHHNLRGAEADADEAFCEELCLTHGLVLNKVSVPVAELAKEQGWTLEEAGRNARYEAFETIKREHGADKIAVAHHKNDLAETVLFQLFRGSRLKGLAGMEAKRDHVIRPLLCVTRREIEEYLKEKGQAFCTDRTNLEEDYTRNRIRNKLLPIAEDLQPRVVEHIADTAEYLARVEVYLEEQTKLWYDKAVQRQEESVLINLDSLKDADKLFKERVVYCALCVAAGGKKDMTATAVADCLALGEKQTGRQICLPLGLTVVREYDVLRIFHEQERQEATEISVGHFPFEVDFSGENQKIRLEVITLEESVESFIEKAGGIPKSNYTKWFDYDTIDADISLRTARTEDVISLYTDGRGKSVRDVMTDAKIPKEERSRRLVLAAGDRVLWIPGVRGSEAYRVTQQTKRILIATLERNGHGR